jgi:disulfide bond formation protein DsbB
MATASPSASVKPDLKILWTRLAFFASVVGVVGSLYLSLGMDLKACPLCFYQRAFIMAVSAVLGLGLFMPGVPAAALTPLALAPAMAGACVAGWHTYLVANGTLECPAGVTATLLAPHESLVVFAIVLALLIIDLFHQSRYVMQGIGAMLIGVVFCTTSIRATPSQQTQPAPAPLDGCRKVVHPKT